MISDRVRPFGRIYPPAHFQLFLSDTKALRESYWSDDVGWAVGGRAPLPSSIYVYDAIWVSSAFGSRLTGPVETFGVAIGRALNGWPINGRGPKSTENGLRRRRYWDSRLVQRSPGARRPNPRMPHPRIRSPTIRPTAPISFAPRNASSTKNSTEAQMPMSKLAERAAPSRDYDAD